MSAPLITQVIRVSDKIETPIVCIYDHNGLYEIEEYKDWLSGHMVVNGYPSWIKGIQFFNGAKNGACRIVNYLGYGGYIFPVDEWNDYEAYHVAVKIFINEDTGKIYWQPQWTKNKTKVWMKNPLQKDFDHLRQKPNPVVSLSNQ
jgi:hypothetical protein